MHHIIEARLSLRPEGGTMRNNVIRHGDLLDLLKQIPSLLTMPRRCHHHPYHNIRSRIRLIRGMTLVHRQSSVPTSAGFGNDATAQSRFRRRTDCGVMFDAGIGPEIVNVVHKDLLLEK